MSPLDGAAMHLEPFLTKQITKLKEKINEMHQFYLKV